MHAESRNRVNLCIQGNGGAVSAFLVIVRERFFCNQQAERIVRLRAAGPTEALTLEGHAPFQAALKSGLTMAILSTASRSGLRKIYKKKPPEAERFRRPFCLWLTGLMFWELLQLSPASRFAD
ncbi:MAG: hypothetical protein HFE86_06230 [Clostridiales bacterium]|nr:hypothetical protein [Clostridiales bacterium]